MIYLYKVSEILHNLKLTVAENFPLIDVIGEVFEIKLNNKSGHIYFSLKEEKYALLCACWQSKVEKNKTLISEGKNVKIRGRVQTFVASGKIYLDVQAVTSYDKGDIAIYLERITEKLQKEGLFDDKHKKSLPLFPNSLGLISSKDGAVVGDILTTLQQTFPCKVQLYDVNVQGAESVASIIKALEYFQKLPLKQQPDVIIIARGGGALDDLFHFNDEALIRAIFSCSIPLISAIGHEINSTLADRVADKAVVTPTASVLFLPRLADILENINKLQLNQTVAWQQYCHQLAYNINFLNKYLKNPEFSLNTFKDNLHNITHKLKYNFTYNIQTLALKVNMLQIKIQEPILINHKINQLAQLITALDKIHDTLAYHSYNLINLQRVLNNFSLKNTLKRGFSIISQEGKLISSTVGLSNKNNAYNIEFYDNNIDVKITLTKTKQ